MINGLVEELSKDKHEVEIGYRGEHYKQMKERVEAVYTCKVYTNEWGYKIRNKCCMNMYLSTSQS